MVKPLRVKRNQLKWYRHLIRTPPERLILHVFHICMTGRRLWGRSRVHWSSYLAWENSRIPLEDLEHVVGKREVWITCCQCDPTLDKWQNLDWWMDVNLNTHVNVYLDIFYSCVQLVSLKEFTWDTASSSCLSETLENVRVVSQKNTANNCQTQSVFSRGSHVSYTYVYLKLFTYFLKCIWDKLVSEKTQPVTLIIVSHSFSEE